MIKVINPKIENVCQSVAGHTFSGQKFSLAMFCICIILIQNTLGEQIQIIIFVICIDEQILIFFVKI